MVRPLRYPVAGGWYHVFGRGWERRRIFSDNHDREHFLELIGALTEKYRFSIHAYVLMDNHHHLIIETPEANLSMGMQWFNTSYSAWYNARHNRVGSLWQGRYRDVLIENSAWAYELSGYIHLNPLRIAGLGLDKRGRMLEGKGFRIPSKEEAKERLQALRNFRWSSYRAYGGYCSGPGWLTTAELLARADSDPAMQSSSYRAYIRQRLTQGVDPGHAERLRDVVAIGGASFARKIRQRAGMGDQEVDHRRELRRLAKESQIRSVVEKLMGEPLDEFAQKRGSPGRGLYLWAVRKYCGLTLREAGMALGGMKPSTVDMAVKRWKTRLEHDELSAKLADQLKREFAEMQKVEGCPPLPL